MSEQVEQEAAVTVSITSLEAGEKEVQLEAGEVFDFASDGPLAVQVEAHSDEDDD